MAAQQKLPVRIAHAAALLIFIVVPYGAGARVFAFRTAVPFQFVVGRETLPAATYTVEVLLGQSQALDATGVIVLKTSDGRVYRTAFTTVADHRRPNPPRSSLVFKRLAGKHYLTLVTMASTDLELGIGSLGPPDAATDDFTEVPMETLR